MSRPRNPAVVPAATVTWHKVGDRCLTARAGDLVLVDQPGTRSGWFIKAGEWLRPLNRPFSWTHHACGVEVGGASAVVIQETAKGAVCSPLSVFDAANYCVISPTNATIRQRQLAVAFLRWSLGSGYGWWSIPGDALDDLTGLHLSLGTYGRMVCSTSASRMAERWGLIPDRDPTAVQPADIARYWGLSKTTAADSFASPPGKSLLVPAHRTLARPEH